MVKLIETSKLVTLTIGYIFCVLVFLSALQKYTSLVTVSFYALDIEFSINS